jgi:hypothetical protein
LLVAAFLMLLLLPERFNDLLDRAGFTKGSLLGFDWEKKIKVSAEQAKGAGDAISQVEGRLKEFDDRLRALDKQVSDVNVKSAIALLSRDVQASLQETAKADRAAKSSVLTQQQLISQVAPAAVETTGWMYHQGHRDHELSGAQGLADRLRRRRPRLHRRSARRPAARPGRAHRVQGPPGAAGHLRGVENAAAGGPRLHPLSSAARGRWRVSPRPAGTPSSRSSDR